MMKICPFCHAKNDDTAQNCVNCNLNLQNPVPVQQKSNSVLILIIVLLFLIIITGMVLVFLALSGKNPSRSPNGTTTPTEATTEFSEPDTTEPIVTDTVPDEPSDTDPVTEPTTTAPKSTPEIGCHIQVQVNPSRDDFAYTLLITSGSYDNYYVECNGYFKGDTSGQQILSEKHSEKSLSLISSSELDHITVTVTPYYSDGTSGAAVTCTAQNPEYLWLGTPHTGTGKVILRTIPDDYGDSAGINIVTKIPDGEKVSVFDCGISKWYYIIYGNYSGYAKQEYIQPVPPDTPEPEPTTEPTTYLWQGTPHTGTGKVILRSSMDDSSDSNIITKIADGEEVSVYSVGSSKWYYIIYGNYSGYAKREYIQPDTPEPEPITYLWQGTPHTGTGKVILRSSMDDSSDSNIITKIADGEEVSVYDCNSSKWYYIFWNGYEGYAKQEYIQRISIVPVGYGTPHTSTGKVILRRSPDDSSDSNIITKIEDGEEVYVFDCGNSKWYYIKWNGYEGYAKKTYIQITEYNNNEIHGEG